MDKILMDDLINELKTIGTGISDLRPQQIRTGKPVSLYEALEDSKEREIEALVALRSINGERYPLYLLEESAGTLDYMSLFTNLQPVLRSGGILVVDELERSLHPDITARIMGLFLDKDKNPKDAQLLFTMHNPLFLEALTKTQIFIVEKGAGEETGVKRLDEIKGVRNDENFFVKYMDGEYGGKPRIKEK
jgi:predicted ATPase